MGITSALRAVASEIISASQVELAVEPWRFERQDRGQHLFPSSLLSSSHKPEVLLVDPRCGNPSNFTPMRTDWIVNKLGWVPSPQESVVRACGIRGASIRCVILLHQRLTE